jgi:ubiquinone/menaquinone biosynthesis C-methylase UbiE
MAANYDNSAWFYDRLSRVIFGRAIVRSQVYLLPSIQAGSTVLIAGGGTGWILQEIAKVHPSGLTIIYVEISVKMMALSRKRNPGANKVTFINEAVENLSSQPSYDVVLTPFLFDNFTEQNFQKLFAHIHNTIKPGGIWLNSDFRLSGKRWQKILLKSMILFFRLICKIESTRLPEIEKCFARHGYKIIAQKSFFGDFILSTVYKK